MNKKILIFIGIGIAVAALGIGVYFFLIPRCPASCDDGYLYTQDVCSKKTDYECSYTTIEKYCRNKICEAGETYENCPEDCPSCDDNNKCTKDSYDYHQQKCIYESDAACYSKTITLTPATTGIDYQVKIELNSSNFNYSKAKTNGEDIRFFDKGGNSLDYWIEDWNGAGRVSVVWVKVSSPQTDEIYMYYGYPNAISASTASAVFEFFDDFSYSDESALTKVWNKYGTPVIELSDGIVTITAPQDKEHGGQHIFKSVGSTTLLNNIVEINTKRFSGHDSHMANIGYASSVGGSISDGDSWAVLRYSPSFDGSLVVFGGNHGSIASSPIGSFNVIKIYHQEGVSYAYEPTSTKVAEYSWPTEPPPGEYVLLGGATTTYGTGKASYDWIRVRKYTSTEPIATVGDEEAVSEGTGPIYD